MTKTKSQKAEKKTYRIFLSAAEASGDRLCAKLITALKQTDYDIEIVGVGGPKMAEAGCEVLITTTKKPAMLYKALLEIFFFIKVIRKAKAYLKENKVDLVVVCDSPAFNFHIAKAAKATNVKTLFYVAPQLWAWAAWRIKKLKNLCTASLAAMLPFEVEWFGERGLKCEFVGNPILDDVDVAGMKGKDYKNYSIASAHIALMPGSRPAEIKALWPAMQEIARTIKARHPSVKFTAVAADEDILETLKASEFKILRCNYVTDGVFDVAKNADLTLVASGTATIQVAAAACPMIIMYQSNKFLWNTIGKRLIKTPYLSLVNIIAQREMTPEFMPCFSSTYPMVKACDKLLNDAKAMKLLSSELVELVKPLAQSDASENVARMVIEALQAEE